MSELRSPSRHGGGHAQRPVQLSMVLHHERGTTAQAELFQAARARLRVEELLSAVSSLPLRTRIACGSSGDKRRIPSHCTPKAEGRSLSYAPASIPALFPSSREGKY